MHDNESQGSIKVLLHAQCASARSTYPSLLEAQQAILVTMGQLISTCTTMNLKAQSRCCCMLSVHLLEAPILHYLRLSRLY
mmetsp:Transcript_141947/g.245531  ORF Transcript_141947/g.245531 Transcript_141947/m.245531 type:complete len:81 (-) Transcript_141947:48-290(-)